MDEHVFWIVTPCSLVDIHYTDFSGSSRLLITVTLWREQNFWNVGRLLPFIHQLGGQTDRRIVAAGSFENTCTLTARVSYGYIYYACCNGEKDWRWNVSAHEPQSTVSSSKMQKPASSSRFCYGSSSWRHRLCVPCNWRWEGTTVHTVVLVATLLSRWLFEHVYK